MSLGEAIATARRARGLTQLDLSDRLGITQAALSRYENDLRDVSDDALSRIATELGVTADLLRRARRLEGALAAHAHMRRRATAKPSAWRRLEAQLNLYRLHVDKVGEQIDIRCDLTLPWLDPFEYEPATAARILRAEWRMPQGPVRSVAEWMEAAGCVIIDSDFGTRRVDGLSQWSGTHPVVMLNIAAPTDRRRLTLAHELGHLCLHSQGVPDDPEVEATDFAAEFLMPANLIRSQLRNLTTGKLHDLKRYWGVSMQALIERAHRLEVITVRERTNLYKRFSAKGWRRQEPLSDQLTPERPRLTANIGEAMLSQGLSPQEVNSITGFSPGTPNSPFLQARRHLQPVANPPQPQRAANT